MVNARRTVLSPGVRTAAVVLLAAAALLAGALPAPAENGRGIRFADRSAVWNLAFRHEDGSTGRRHLPETMGSGVGWLDYDADGREDLYLVDSGPLPGTSPAEAEPDVTARPVGANALYRNVGGGFELAADVAADRGYGKGVAIADYDADGHVDLYVTNWGADALYRNNGDGTFTDVTAEAGLGDRRLTSSAAWADLDGDERLDLFVVTYVEYDIATVPPCGRVPEGIFDYCHPALFSGQPDILYRNRGDGTFEDRSSALELANPGYGKGLAVIVADLDGDRLPDIYVANDTTPNFVYFNRGAMRFVEEGEMSGTAVGGGGLPQAGMGIDVGDLDGNLDPDLVVTNFAMEPYNLYRAISAGFYVDDTYALGLGGATLAPLGFGIVLGDLDLDGDLDLAVVNGHILREGVEAAQPNQVFESRMTDLRAAAQAEDRIAPPDPSREAPQPLDWRPRGGLLQEVTGGAGPGFSRPRISRGLALADPDGDGWLDAVVTNVDGPAQLLVNTTPGDGNALVLRLRGRGGNRHAIGARAWITPHGPAAGHPAVAADGVEGYPQERVVRTAVSYQSQGTMDLHLGLGDLTAARVLIEWPDGELESADVVAGRLYLIERGRGAVASRPLATRSGEQIAS